MGTARVLAANFRRSERATINAPIAISAKVALKLPGATQLIQVPMISVASCIV